MSSNDTLLLSQKNFLTSLYQQKTNYQHLISKYHSLPKIIEQKKQIIDNLKLSNHKLTNQVAFRTEELNQLIKRLQEFQRMESQVSKLEEKQRMMQSQFEDYQQLNSRLQKEIKLLRSESQVLRGKAVIEYNKITEAREELSAQITKKQVLQKNLQEKRKNGQNLKKKIKALKQQQKRKLSHKQRIKQADLEKEVNNLREFYQQNRRQFQVQSNTTYVNEEQYKEIIQQLSKMHEQNSRYGQQKRINQILKKQRGELQSRITFLQGINIEFIDEKKKMLVELKQKYNLSYAKKQFQTQHIENLQKELAELQIQCPEGLAQLKKNVRRKKQPKLKQIKKTKGIPEQPIENEVEQKISSRLKGHKLKKIFYYLIGIFLIFGLVITQTIGYII